MRAFTHMLLQASAGGGVVTGQAVYSIYGDGSTDFIVPAGVTSISAVCVSPGGYPDWSKGSNGGTLVYGNDIPVTPGQTLTCQFQYAYGSWLKVGNIYGTSLIFAWQNPNATRYGGTNVSGFGLGGANGGYDGGIDARGGAGGAGGYTGSGGNGGTSSATAGTNGSGGGGGGGAQGRTYYRYGQFVDGGSGGGGGVGLLGQGSNGAGGVWQYNGDWGPEGGGGGSGGGAGGASYSYPVYVCCDPNPVANVAVGGSGGAYGGGSGASGQEVWGAGAIRIIWPGNTRSFPNTNTGNL